jgi:hypothetical protein
MTSTDLHISFNSSKFKEIGMTLIETLLNSQANIIKI